MFFPKLRRRAKWVFLFLAIAFAIGFVAFGVGTGVPGTSIGDVFSDFIGRGQAGGGASLEEAREKAAKNPTDSQAQLELANALQREGQTREAISALERYTTLRPRDSEALRQLAVLWGTQAAQAREEAQVAGIEAQEASVAQTFAPPEPFVQTLSSNRIEEALSQHAQQRAGEAGSRAEQAARNEANVYERLTVLEPEDATIWLQFGAASQAAGDAERAVAAYERFLELAPDDASAPIVREQLELLRPANSG